MKPLSKHLAVLLGAFVLALGLGLSQAPAFAQGQPALVNPQASSVTEQELLKALQNGDGTSIRGRVTIPDKRASNLITPGGRDWRSFHQGTLHWIGGIAVLGMLALLAVFYAVRGKVRLDKGFSGTTILRFGTFERVMHWMTATCFIVLALSGLNLTFGRRLVIPLLGEDAFAVLADYGRLAHHYLAFPFMLGIVLMLVVWVKDNIPEKLDWTWLKAGGGIVGHDHPPAKRFNAGQKGIFWSVIIGGAALSISGLILLFPFTGGRGVSDQQFWALIHAVVAVLMVAVIFAHIYIGTLGMEGAFDAMGTGRVDLNWAREHHSLWAEEELAREKPVPAGPKMQPAE